jgi:hypothetical protein
VAQLEKACVVRRIEQRAKSGGQMQNLYRITPVIYWEYCIHKVAHAKTLPDNLDEILNYLHKQREEAIEEELQYQRENPMEAQVVGMRGTAKSRIKAITKQIESGKKIDNQGRPLEDMLAHWHEVYDIHTRRATKMRNQRLSARVSQKPYSSRLSECLPHTRLHG